MSAIMKMAIFLFPSFVVLSLLPCLVMPLTVSVKDLPLHTRSRYIVDAKGHRVKLACVSWPSHLEAVVAEGLNKQPLDAISKKIVAMGFNCVRLTWPLVLATNGTLAHKITVRESLKTLNQTLEAGFQANNPSILDLCHTEAFTEVVSNLANNNLMVIIDNHITQATWCCDNNDHNGFFNDPFFDPDMWVVGLTRMAKRFRHTRNVIGMSLRNQLRGPKANSPDWYKYIQRGAEAVHAANPNVLVIVGGINYDTDLSFLSLQPLKLNFKRKLVFELHWYGFSDGSKSWTEINSNDMCAAVTTSFITRGGFLLKKGFPLFLSEFGADQRGTNINDNRYLNCLLSVVADLDLDFAIWTLQGSYYYRQGQLDMEEVYGMLNKNWSAPRNASYLNKISSIQSPFKGPGLLETKPYKMLFHPLTGECIFRESKYGPLRLGNCSASEQWEYTADHRLLISRSGLCLQLDGKGKAAKLGTKCNTKDSSWYAISRTKMHLSAKTSSGHHFCLDINDDKEKTIVTNTCHCLSSNSTCDPARQWFKLVVSTRLPKVSRL